jgi:hypothetical protein
MDTKGATEEVQKKKNLCLKERFDEIENIIISLKTQVEEANRIEQVLIAQLKEK